ncbi:MAG: gfo/Idh/MocA family oxidoreductase, partial [Planctomycetia bacterium]
MPRPPVTSPPRAATPALSAAPARLATPAHGATQPLSRRRLLGAVAATAALAPTALRGDTGSRIRVAVMGLGGRGQALATHTTSVLGVEWNRVADVDLDRAGKTADSLAKLPAGTTPRVEGDFRRFLDDRSIDLVVVATSNHWHAPATILA